MINLAKEFKPRKSPLIPADVATAEKQKLQSHKNLQAVLLDPESSDLEKSSAKLEFSTARKSHRRIWRRHQFSLESSNYAKTHEILSNDPKNAFKHLKSLKSTASGKIPELKAGDNIYYGENVADGFFQNIKNLKTLNSDTKACESCLNIKFDYSLIIDLCKAGQKIPSITLVKAEELLQALKPQFCDHFNMSALHFIHGSPLAVLHFQFIVNSAIENIDVTSCEEMNDTHACVLFKGHSKDKTLASSYRTISSFSELGSAMNLVLFC